MKSSKLVNNISDELKKEIPKLAPGQNVTFRMLNGTPNPDPDPKEKEKDPFLYGKVQIPTNTRIYDKYKKEYVDWCCADQWEGERPTRYRFFMPGMGTYSRFQGKFSLVGGNAQDEELYEFLYLSPNRKGSPCFDSGVECLFEILDHKAEIKSSNSRIDKLRLAIAYVDELKKNPTKARAIMASFNKPDYQDDEVLGVHIHNLATDTKTIDDFIAAYEGDTMPIVGILKEALDAGIVVHDLQTGDVNIGGVKVLTIASASGFLKEFAGWIKADKNGQDVLNNIKSRLPKKAEAAK